MSATNRVNGRSIVTVGALLVLSSSLATLVACARDGEEEVADDELVAGSGAPLGNTRFAKDERTITPKNAKNLGVKWAFETKGAVSTTPAIVGGYLYVTDWGGYLHKVKAATGDEVWSKRLDEAFAAGTGTPEDTEPYVTIDGVQWPTRLVAQGAPQVSGDTVVVTLKRPLTTPGRVDPKVYDPSNKTNPFGVTNPPAGAFIAAFDKNTGALRWKQAMHDSHKDASGKTVGMSGVTATADPVIYGNRVYAAIANETGLLRIPAPGKNAYSDFYFRGKVTCYNLADGKVIWTRYTISDELYKPTADGTRYTGAGIWGTPVVDPARNLLYVATGNNTSATTDDINAGRFPTAAEGNNVDSVMALKLDTGEIAWATSTQKGDRDVYQGGISAFAPVTADTDGNPVRNAAGAIPIKKVALPPQVPAKDFDLGAALNVYDVKTSTGTRRIVGAGSKSGMYHAMDPDTGAVLWKTQAGPGGILGGIHWSGAVDDSRIYVSCNNSLKPWPLQGGEEGGGWTAMNAATGEIEWHKSDPLGALTATGTGGALVSQHYRPIGASVYPTLAGGKNIWVGTDSPATVANGVVFVGTGDMEFQRENDQVKLVDNFPIAIPGKGGHMYALDARTGEQLWSFESGSSVYGGAAVKDGVVYWGTGYPRFGQNPVNIKRDKQGNPILQDGQPVPMPTGAGGFGGAGYLFAFEPKK